MQVGFSVHSKLSMAMNGSSFLFKDANVGSKVLLESVSGLNLELFLSLHDDLAMLSYHNSRNHLHMLLSNTRTHMYIPSKG